MKKYCAFFEGRECNTQCVSLGYHQGQLTCARLKSAVSFEEINEQAITSREAGYGITGGKRN